MGKIAKDWHNETKITKACLGWREFTQWGKLTKSDSKTTVEKRKWYSKEQKISVLSDASMAILDCNLWWQNSNTLRCFARKCYLACQTIHIICLSYFFLGKQTAQPWSIWQDFMLVFLIYLQIQTTTPSPGD